MQHGDQQFTGGKNPLRDWRFLLIATVVVFIATIPYWMPKDAARADYHAPVVKKSSAIR